MKIVDRYLLREYLEPVFYCLSAFCMIFVVFDLFDNVSKFIEARTPLRLILLYYARFLLPNLEFLIPASLLLATLYTLWQKTRHNELTAMRASGLSLYRILVPFLAVGFAFTLLTAALKETIAPRALMWAERFEDSRFTDPSPRQVYFDRAFYHTQAHRLWHFEQLDMARPNRLIGVRVTQERPNRSRERVLLADRAEYLDGQWWFYELREQWFDEQDNPVTAMQPVPAAGPDAGVEVPWLNETPEHFVLEVKPPEALTSLDLATYIRHRSLTPQTLAEKSFDLQRRLAMPWACFIVTLFAIPAGARSSRHSALSGIFMALALFFGFYALMQIGVILGKQEIIWPWLGAWLSNIVFLVAGLVMLARMR